MKNTINGVRTLAKVGTYNQVDNLTFHTAGIQIKMKALNDVQDIVEPESRT